MKFNCKFESFRASEMEQPDNDLIKTFVDLDKNEIKYYWNNQQWSDYLWKHSPLVVTCFKDLELIGLCVGRVGHDYDFFDLDKIIIKHNYQGLGLGNALFKKFLRKVRFECLANEVSKTKILLEVSCDNVKAVKFYKYLGFSVIHLAKKYYTDGQDALKMAKIYSIL